MNNLSNELFYEISYSQLIKHNEELCGDSIISKNMLDYHSLILADGLGSGVKANILSTLTSKIISKMIENDCELKDIIETIGSTLPTCSYRKLAYSTFTFGKFYPDGKVDLIEFDNPPVILIRNGSTINISYEKMKIQDKEINHSEIKLQTGDFLIFLSDGEVHAGIGGMLNLGWSWENIAKFSEKLSRKSFSAKNFAYELTNVAQKLYDEKPGDDTSVAVVKVRNKKYLEVMIGAPEDRENDIIVVKNLMNGKGKKVVCGGTTSNIVSREIKKKIDIDISSMENGIPPIGKIEGIDLCTEGIITLKKTLKLMKDIPSYKKFELKKDGAHRLANELLSADHINFHIGKAINSAYHKIEMAGEYGLKFQITEKIIKILKNKNKSITIKYY